MLSDLAKKDKLWRQIAYSICKDKVLADDIVNEMYLRRYDNDRGQDLTDYYIVCTMKSIFLNYKKTNRLIPVEEIRTDEYVNGGFQPTDQEKKYLDRAKNLPFAKRELIELNYDYSLREIQQKFGINYGYVHKAVNEARQTILGKDIHKYKNKRLKHKKMNQSIGLGDTVEKITKATGIKKLVDAITGDKDCGCDKRKEYLNRLWRYKLKPKCLTDQEIKDYHNFILTRKVQLTGNGKAYGKLSQKDVEFVCDFYEVVFNVKTEYPSCSSCRGTALKLVDMIYKLDTVFINNVPDEKKPNNEPKKETKVKTPAKTRKPRKTVKKRTTKKKTIQNK